ncbi:hypothetical protein GJ744_007313 [Endocarpon pusillum]|uniref:Uncharacterized protein n=1 Tax=Endocarpon pusillum TaxID=364733 RepID=A0A8H7AKV0_9EURO|nr:hypothetical protein GJ744_007313 [Endocarpon pusillum]
MFSTPTPPTFYSFDSTDQQLPLLRAPRYPRARSHPSLSISQWLQMPDLQAKLLRRPQSGEQ